MSLPDIGAPDMGAEDPTVIVVRRGAADRFAALHTVFTCEGVDVLWDRRVVERRRGNRVSPDGAERRQVDRRGPVPPSWTLLDFVVVVSGSEPGAQTTTASRVADGQPPEN
jgi:hypothetical protein